MKWGKASLKKLGELCPPMRRVLDRAIGYGIIDMTIVETTRSRQKQDEYFESGKSRVRWPNGKHNVTDKRSLSLAVDVAPWMPSGLSWNKAHCCVMAGLILAAAKEEGVTVRWGGNWDMDSEPITDQDFQDLVHFELVEA